MGQPTSLPKGRHEAIPALIAAATHEFAERGYNATSVRAISVRAGVNHGLVHRHFGSKANLLSAVLDDLAAQVARDLEASPQARTQRTPATRLFQQVLARALLDGADLGGQRTHPVMDWAIAQATHTTGGTPESVRIGVTHALALDLGWALFEPFLVGAARLDDTEARAAHDSIPAAQQALVRLHTDSA
ncbi:TetR/AcrR family transcriptional regulator [Cumulibacter soli]|uniref:TetR/AcrR family transcriptional regulator n=1 Tax=Cumulibacter soli TaxID=2546344 RepID=UPI0010676D3C|nr:TetR/AcrR family transcriptional regulator [Cumulibacter soli]